MKPKISVVIPAFNEEKLLPLCLASLAKQSYPKELFEVIVVDNGSKDRTYEIIREFGFRAYKYAELQGAAPARVFGVKHAKGSIIAFTDADAIVSPLWLQTIDSLLENSKIVAIGGRARTQEKNIWVRVYISFYNSFHMINDMFGMPLLWGFTMAVKKDAYDAVGGIDQSMTSAEDWDIGFRLQKRFGKRSVRYVPELYIYTAARKEKNLATLPRFIFSGIHNYVNFALLRRRKLKPLFNVR